jgi:hypothetical protein
MIRKMLKKALAPIVRELVQQEYNSLLERIAEKTALSLNRSLAQALRESHPDSPGKAAPDSSE